MGQKIVASFSDYRDVLLRYEFPSTNNNLSLFYFMVMHKRLPQCNV